MSRVGRVGRAVRGRGRRSSVSNPFDARRGPLLLAAVAAATHVAVLGGGYAGLTLTARLEPSLPPDVDLTLVDESPDHLVQHELHRAIRRPGVANEIRISLPEALERATVRVARVEAIDRDERVVSLSDGRLEYDLVAIFLGAQTAYYGLEGFRSTGFR